MNRSSLRTNRLTFIKTSGGILPIILEESIEEYTSNEWKPNRKMSTCNRLDLQTLGSQTLGGEIPKSQGRRLAIQFLVVKSPLYLTGTCQVVKLPPVLWRWHVSLLSPQTK